MMKVKSLDRLPTAYAMQRFLLMCVTLAFATLTQAQNFSVLHSFGGAKDGGHPVAGLALDSAGNLYGTTNGNGVTNLGTVFKVDSAGHETVLHDFTGTNGDGSYPTAGVIRDNAGNLYGTTQFGGSNRGGIVYKIDPTGAETVLHSFPGFAGDGSNPVAKLLRDAAGNLYGTTNVGGTSGLGTVFKIDKNGNETLLHSFAGGSDGELPYAEVIHDAAGNLYGTTYAGGASNYGVVFKLDTAGTGTILYSFGGGFDGKHPMAGLLRDNAGNFYGTTYLGGGGDNGTAFLLQPSGQEIVLHAFDGNDDGALPNGTLIRDVAGNLYGTTETGTKFGEGTVYKLIVTGKLALMYTFTAQQDGGEPIGNLVQDTNRNLYGTTNGGGKFGSGTVFRLSP